MIVAVFQTLLSLKFVFHISHSCHGLFICFKSLRIVKPSISSWAITKTSGRPDVAHMLWFAVSWSRVYNGYFAMFALSQICPSSHTLLPVKQFIYFFMHFKITCRWCFSHLTFHCAYLYLDFNFFFFFVVIQWNEKISRVLFVDFDSLYPCIT